MTFANGIYQPGYYQAQSGPTSDYLAQYKTPYQPAPQTPQQTGNGLIWVQGETGAKSFMVGPGQSVLLMDSEGSRFYLKSADASGMPLPLRIFEYTELTNNAPTQTAIQAPQTSFDPSRYITRDELEERLARLLAEKESIKNAESIV